MRSVALVIGAGSATALPAALAFAAAVLATVGLSLLVGPRPWSPLRRGGGHLRVLRVLARAGRRLPGFEAPGELAGRIAAAGLPGGVGVREVMAAKAAAASLGGVACAGLSIATPGRLGIVVLAAGPAAGFLAPDLWLARRTEARTRDVRRELPTLLDMLRVTVDAGASLTAALAEVGARARGTLAAEWRAVGQQGVLGVPLEHALAGMAHRLPQPEIVALIGALDRARRHGAPLATVLGRQAHEARLAARRAVQEEAARAGPKIQLVVALLLVPSVLLLVAAALATALLDSGGLQAA